MGFIEVYDSLLELFPQIDSRALKAVAIEHSKDVDKAVEAVLEEIIPFLIERSAPSSPNLNQSAYSTEPSEAHSGLIEGNQTEDDQLMNTMGTAGLKNDYNLNSGNQQAFHDDEPNEPFCYKNREGVDKTAESRKNHESRMEMNADMQSPSEPVALIDLNAVDVIQMEISKSLETEETISGDKFSENNMGTSSDGNLQHAEEVSGDLEMDFGNKENDVTEVPLESSVLLVEVPDTHESNLENLNSLNATMSQSSEAHVMDVVEEIIKETRSNKKTLFTAMESVICLMRQIEVKEQAVKQAKEESEVGANDILDKVEELKHMLQHAKEANDMHAGEVYGEKAILGTELKELQSRVVSLSDERDKSLVVLDEMRQTLEVRLAAAENALQSAEQEKLEKENGARKLLSDQELIMEKVVQESKILKQQSEDNTKLQEFLVDRGRVVDMLQGEIAVICEDVRVLKQKFDEHVPLSKSLFSSQTSFILASSRPRSPNTDQVGPLDYQVPVRDDDDLLLETRKNGDHEHVFEEKADGEDRKALVDDGWDLIGVEINA